MTARERESECVCECVATLWGCSVRVLGAVGSGVDPAGGDVGRGLEQLLLHVGLLDERTRRAQQDDAVQNLQGDHPAHTQTHTHTHTHTQTLFLHSMTMSQQFPTIPRKTL